jgi:uncharacterized protein YjbJ (UPF0337 family)
MKSSRRDNAEGNIHQITGKAKQAIGKLTNNPDMQAKGEAKKLDGAMQETIGDVKKAVGK